MSFCILIIHEIWRLKDVFLGFLKKKKISLHSTISQVLNVSCASFYGFSCGFMPEMATWATAGVKLADKFGVGSTETDTWCCPATGTKNLQLLLWCCPGGAEEQPRDTLRFTVTALNRLFEVKTDDILLPCSYGFCKLKECYCGTSSWLFLKSLSLLLNIGAGFSMGQRHSHNI